MGTGLIYCYKYLEKGTHGKFIGERKDKRDQESLIDCSTFNIPTDLLQNGQQPFDFDSRPLAQAGTTILIVFGLVS
jgi:hypothetical protein